MDIINKIKIIDLKIYKLKRKIEKLTIKKHNLINEKDVDIIVKNRDKESK